MKHTFNYGHVRVRDLRAISSVNVLSGESNVTAIDVKGEPLRPTRRFWTSFFVRFGISDNVFRYFDHNEVFDRIARRVPDDMLRYCVEKDPDGKRSLLAVSNPDRPVAHPVEIHDLIKRYGGEDVQYDRGVLTSFHVPRSGEVATNVGPDRFKNRFVLKAPVDAYGNPCIYLALLRMVCSNGMVGYAPTFRSEIRVGREVVHSLTRALDTYDNGEGYAAMRQRFESAQNSWASIHETHKLYKTIVKQQSAGQLGSTVLNDFHRVTGDLHEIYGLANLDNLSVKRQRVLPARCRVYDLLNFASELATHHARPAASQALQAHIGTTISDEYDMEGTAEEVSHFDDFFLNDQAGGPTVSLN